MRDNDVEESIKRKIVAHARSLQLVERGHMCPVWSSRQDRADVGGIASNAECWLLIKTGGTNAGTGTMVDNGLFSWLFSF